MKLSLWLQESDGTRRLGEVSSSFRRYSEDQGGLALAVAAVFLGLILLAVLYSLLSRRSRAAHWRLFRQFAEASGLSSSEAKMMVFVAERVQLDNPLALFVKRSLFESAVSDLGIEAGLASALRRKVYGP
jgi:hypothetical protein